MISCSVYLFPFSGTQEKKKKKKKSNYNLRRTLLYAFSIPCSRKYPFRSSIYIYNVVLWSEAARFGGLVMGGKEAASKQARGRTFLWWQINTHPHSRSLICLQGENERGFFFFFSVAKKAHPRVSMFFNRAECRLSTRAFSDAHLSGWSTRRTPGKQLIAFALHHPIN